MKKKTIVYYCFGPQTVWMSTILSETVFADFINIAVIRQELAENYNIDVGFFDKVYLKTKNMPVSDCVDQMVDIINEEKPDEIAFFTWGGNSNLEIYNTIPEGVKVVLIDEGTSSYNYEEHFTVFSGQIDFSKIKEIWLMDPDLSINSCKIPIYRIPIKEYLNDRSRFMNYIERVNRFFNYKEIVCESIMYFDNYFVKGAFLPKDLYDSFIENIMLVISGNKVTIKLHPTDIVMSGEQRYMNYEVHILENNMIPWEIVVLNYIFDKYCRNCESCFPQLLLSVNSSSLITTQILLALFGYEIPIVFLYKFLRDWLPKKINIVESVLENYKKTYPDRKAFIPDTWIDFLSIIEDSFGSVDYRVINIIENKEKQNLLNFKQDYVVCRNKANRFDRIFPLIYNSDRIRRLLNNMGYKKIAIYGYGDVGVLLNSLLIANGIETIVAEKLPRKGVISIEELKKCVLVCDLIIITPILDYYKIKEELGNLSSIVLFEEFIKMANT